MNNIFQLLLLYIVGTLSDQVPGKPTGVYSSDMTSRSVIIRWEDPLTTNKTGGNVVDFMVSCSGNKFYNTTFKDGKIGFTANREIRFNDLFPGTRYTCFVAAQNAAGTGDHSSSVIFNTPVEGAPPPTPPILIRNSEPLVSVDVRFFGASDKNGQISFYQVIVFQTNEAEASLPSEIDTNQTKASESQLQYWVAWILYPNEMPCTLTIGDGKSRYSYTNAPLDVFRNAEILIRAVSTQGERRLYGKWSKVSVIRISPQFSPVVTPSKTSTKMRIPVLKVLGNVRYVKYIVLEKSCITLPRPPNQYKEDELNSYETATSSSGPVPYVAAILSEEAFSNKTFWVGDGSTTKYSVTRQTDNNNQVLEYVNGPLKPDTYYVMFLRFYEKEDVYYSSYWYGPVPTDKRYINHGNSRYTCSDGVYLNIFLSLYIFFVLLS